MAPAGGFTVDENSLMSLGEEDGQPLQYVPCMPYDCALFYMLSNLGEMGPINESSCLWWHFPFGKM